MQTLVPTALATSSWVRALRLMVFAAPTKANLVDVRSVRPTPIVKEEHQRLESLVMSPIAPHWSIVTQTKSLQIRSLRLHSRMPTTQERRHQSTPYPLSSVIQSLPTVLFSIVLWKFTHLIQMARALLFLHAEQVLENCLDR